MVWFVDGVIHTPHDIYHTQIIQHTPYTIHNITYTIHHTSPYTYLYSLSQGCMSTFAMVRRALGLVFMSPRISSLASLLISLQSTGGSFTTTLPGDGVRVCVAYGVWCI
ncbi:hypothetical protein EON63_04240 [archaeon]|nr:MAG: hypothetical protein EON63_04240 [archaeon]